MSESCEIVESLGWATSECPATDVVLVEHHQGNAQSALTLGIAPVPPISAAEATTQVTVDAYAILANAAEASGDVLASLTVTELVLNRARATGTPRAFFNELVEDFAHLEDEIAAADVPQLLLSAAQALSHVDANSMAAFTAVSTAAARDRASPGQEALVESGAEGGATVFLLRRIEELVVTHADGSEEAFPSSVPGYYLLISDAEGASLTMLQTERSYLVQTYADAEADVWMRNPEQVAWVMNSETTAVSWYSNFDFESLIQTPDGVFAVGPDGLYELEGDTDDGLRIDAEVKSGFTDFGRDETKRVGAIYLGYTSQGGLSVTAETQGSGHPPTVFHLEERDAAAPRNSRIVPGKGLRGRYWRLTIRNNNGSDFEIHDATVDLAVSSRRV